MMSRFLALPALALTALLGVSACQPPTDAEVQECEQAFTEVAGARPVAVPDSVRHECHDFLFDNNPDNDRNFGTFWWNGTPYHPDNYVEVNTHDTLTTVHEYGEAFAHEYGHAWRFNHLDSAQRDQTIALSGRDPAPFSDATREELYAEIWRFIVFDDVYGGADWVQASEATAIVAAGLVP